MAELKSSHEPVVITIFDPDTGSKVEYKVHPSIAKAIQRLLEGAPDQTPIANPAWDAACRV